MPKQNTFLAMEMLQADIAVFYPADADFSRFVFQQVIDDDTKVDNAFKLIVSAIKTNGDVYPTAIALNPLTSNEYKANKKVNFGNIMLLRTDIDRFFHNAAPTTPLKLFPKKSTLNNDYVAYKVEGGFAVQSLTFDPSPPATSPLNNP